jgi:hypothetical protein
MMPDPMTPLSDAFPKINKRTTLDELILTYKLRPKFDPPNPYGPSAENQAVARCCEAYDLAYKAASLTDKGEFQTATEAERAYRRAMPPLTGHENIRDFIACVAHAMLINALSCADGARLLYAAQVAHIALNQTGPKTRTRAKPHPEAAP